MHTHESKLEKELIKLHLNSCVRFEVGKGCYEKVCEYCWEEGGRYACKLFGGLHMYAHDSKNE